MKLALLGFGVVGGGLWELLQERPILDVRYVLTRRPRPEVGKRAIHSIEPVLRDPEVGLVAEALGGLHPAYEYVSAALRAGKHVVTANKALIAAYYDELTSLARKNGVALRCTAAVGGGIPWLTALERTRRTDRIQKISGILNGTTNYILDVMTQERRSFGAALSAAQDLGYAESDPTADIDGWDIRRKLLISANIAFGVSLQERDIPMAGIRGITAADIQSFSQAGLVCRMLASAARQNGAVSAFVEPALLPQGAPEAAVPRNYNFISLTGAHLGRQSFFGEGAGRFPTAANMLQDCLDVAAGCRAFYLSTAFPCAIDNSRILHAYYVRTQEPSRFRDIAAGQLGAGIVTAPVPLSLLHGRAGDCQFFAALPEQAVRKQFA